MKRLPSVIIVKSKQVKSEAIKEECESFHQAVGPILFFGQFFAMLPADNLLRKSEEEINFRWTSPKVIYTMLFLLLGTIESSVATRRLLRLGFNIHYAETFFFYTTAMIRSFFIFRLSMKWKEIMKKYRNYEDVFLREPYSIKGCKLSRKLRVFFIISMFFVILEHVFFLVKGFEENRLQIEYCTPVSTDFFLNFLWRYRPHLVYNFPYSPFLLPLYEWINLLQAISWSYSDIIIVLLAIGVKYRFSQYIQYFKVVTSDEKLMTVENFKLLRIHFYQLIDLVHFIDSQVSTLIFISLGHNMLVLMVKLFSALNSNRHHFLDEIYFWFYLVFLIARIYCMLSSCAGIHDTASRAVLYIQKIPSSHFNLDLKRIFDTMTVEAPTLTFSGRKFFFITKSMILGFVGTIVTYELVLLSEIKEEATDFCTFIDY